MERVHRYGDTTSSPMSKRGLASRPNDKIPPPSISMSFESGKETSKLSPWPTSIAVNSSWRGCTAGGNGCQYTNANRASTGTAEAQASQRARRIAQASNNTAEVSASDSHNGGSGTLQSGSKRRCQSATSLRHSKAMPRAPRENATREDRDEPGGNNQREQRDHQDIGRQPGERDAMEVERHGQSEADLDRGGDYRDFVGVEKHSRGGRQRV